MASKCVIRRPKTIYPLPDKSQRQQIQTIQLANPFCGRAPPFIMAASVNRIVKKQTSTIGNFIRRYPESIEISTSMRCILQFDYLYGADVKIIIVYAPDTRRQTKTRCYQPRARNITLHQINKLQCVMMHVVCLLNLQGSGNRTRTETPVHSSNKIDINQRRFRLKTNLLMEIYSWKQLKKSDFENFLSHQSR